MQKHTKLILLFLLCLLTRPTLAQNVNVDSSPRFAVSVKAAHGISVNPSYVVYQTQENGLTKKKYLQVENGSLVSVDLEKTGSFMGENTYNINGLFIVPNLSVDTIRVLELDAKKNVVNCYIYPKNTRMLTLTGYGANGSAQSLSIIHEWDTTTSMIKQHQRFLPLSIGARYNRTCMKRIIRSGAPLDYKRPVTVRAFFNGEEIAIKEMTLEPTDVGGSMLVILQNKGKLLSENFLRRMLSSQFSYPSYLVIKEGKFEYPYFEIASEDLNP